jgi:hypothetical protein
MLKGPKMTAKPCVICGTILDGWVYSFKEATKNSVDPFGLGLVGFQCQNCGAAICERKHLKETKVNNYWGYPKFLCPNCGKPFGLERVIFSREVSKLTPVEVPSTNLETWADIFIDTQTGETLLKAATYGSSLKLVLTNRRLIALMSAPYLNQDTFNFVIPLNQITAVRTEKKMIGTIALLVDTRAGESIKFEGEGSLELFGQAILAALPSASPAVVFPAGEQVYYEGDNLKFIWNSNFGTEIGQEIHEKRFYNTLRMTLAVTNHRMFFYRISNVAEMTGSRAFANVKYGEPRLQFISIPWERIQRISYGGSFLEKGMNLVLTTPVWAYEIPWLQAYPDELIKVEEYHHTCAKCGGEIIGGVGGQRKSKDGSLIEASQTGWHCPTCQVAYHHDKKCGPSKGKCPVCKQPMQAIDRAYSKLTLSDQAIPAAQILTPVPPMGETGKEWNLPITTDLKGFETQVLPAIKLARPSLLIVGK